MSVAYDILSAVRSALRGLALPDIAHVAIRALPIARDEDFVEGQDSVIVVSPSRESIDSEHSENTSVIKYPVYVVLNRRGDLLAEKHVAVVLAFREAIRRKLNYPTLTGAATVFNVDVDFNPPFDPAAWQVAYDLSAILFTFYSDETRSA